MGLGIAIQAHKEGNLQLASEHYKRAIDQKVSKPILYQNYGALLRSMELIDEAIDCYKKGLLLFPDDLGISMNLANAIRDKHPSKAIFLYSKLINRILSSNTNQDSKLLEELVINVVTLLRDYSLHAWAYDCLKYSLAFLDVTSRIALQLLLLADEGQETFLSNYQPKKLLKIIHSHLDNAEFEEQLEAYFALAGHYAAKSEMTLSSIYFSKANQALANHSSLSENIQSKLNCHYWNYSNHLLKEQHFALGWKLYDYGLRAPCAGPQRWQRALAKPFSTSDLSIWRGENLTNKSLLILDEQAIGDVMMFITMIPRLVEEAKFIGILLNDRLISMYQRSFKQYIDSGSIRLFKHSDFHENNLQSSDFDFQIPIASICQYRFDHPSKFQDLQPLLRSNLTEADALKKRYYATSSPSNMLVGISWQGGGKSGRIRQKSLPIQSFLEIIKNVPNCTFVSLQYGDCSNAISLFRDGGVDVIYDDSINPLKDMDSWLSQVSSCDAVLALPIQLLWCWRSKHLHHVLTE